MSLNYGKGIRVDSNWVRNTHVFGLWKVLWDDLEMICLTWGKLCTLGIQDVWFLFNCSLILFETYI